jgi:hypothetical protein
MDPPHNVRIGAATFGQGAFATKVIDVGELIGFYLGEVLDTNAYTARYGGRLSSESSYLYFLRGGGPGAALDLLVLDARDPAKSSWARYINSPRGTASRANVRWGRHLYAGSPRVEIRASRRLKPGDELMIDYGRDYPWAGIIGLSHLGGIALPPEVKKESDGFSDGVHSAADAGAIPQRT